MKETKYSKKSKETIKHKDEYEKVLTRDRLRKLQYYIKKESTQSVINKRSPTISPLKAHTINPIIKKFDIEKNMMLQEVNRNK